MNKRETAQVLAFLRELYPNGAEVTHDTINAWHSLLKGYDYQEIWNASMLVAKTWDAYTMPPPSVIISKLRKDTGIERWHILEKAIRKGQSFTREDFEKLPADIKAYIGSPQTIREMGLMPIDQLSYEKTRFLKQIEVIHERQETNILPEVERLAGLLE